MVVDCAAFKHRRAATRRASRVLRASGAPSWPGPRGRVSRRCASRGSRRWRGTRNVAAARAAAGIKPTAPMHPPGRQSSGLCTLTFAHCSMLQYGKSMSWARSRRGTHSALATYQRWMSLLALDRAAWFSGLVLSTTVPGKPCAQRSSPSRGRGRKAPRVVGRGDDLRAVEPGGAWRSTGRLRLQIRPDAGIGLGRRLRRAMVTARRFVPGRISLYSCTVGPRTWSEGFPSRPHATGPGG